MLGSHLPLMFASFDSDTGNERGRDYWLDYRIRTCDKASSTVRHENSRTCFRHDVGDAQHGKEGSRGFANHSHGLEITNESSGVTSKALGMEMLL